MMRGIEEHPRRAGEPSRRLARLEAGVARELAFDPDQLGELVPSAAHGASEVCEQPLEAPDRRVAPRLGDRDELAQKLHEPEPDGRLLVACTAPGPGALPGEHLANLFRGVLP